MHRREFIKASAVAAAGVLVCTGPAQAVEGQAGWRWCKRCEGLWFAGGGPDRTGKCADGGAHTDVGSGQYFLRGDPKAQGQAGWSFCNKCEGLWFAGGGDKRPGKCPAGDHHDSAGSANYTLVQNVEDAEGQQDWRWCKKCEGLWFAGGGEDRKGKFPAGDGHDTTDSGKYTLTHVG